jgi:hypothetical protein
MMRNLTLTCALALSSLIAAECRAVASRFFHGRFRVVRLLAFATDSGGADWMIDRVSKSPKIGSMQDRVVLLLP